MHVGERLRFLHVIKLINQKIQSPNEILDAGAGNGNYAFYLNKIFPKARITAIDISKTKIANVSSIANLLNLKNIIFDQNTLTNVKEKQKYDLVVCIDVLEHIKNDILAIKNISKSLRPGGSLILHVPKDRKLVYRHFGRFKEFNIEDHVREEYRIEEIIQKIKHSGLKFKEFSYTFGWFGSLAWEIDQLLIVYLRKVRYITFPIFYLLILVDVHRKKNNGNGFLFHCVKK
jgi:SAM-dependent methyltransferase